MAAFTRNTWFKKLTGFDETSAKNVYKKLSYKDGLLKSSVNGKQWHAGYLKTPSLESLRKSMKQRDSPNYGRPCLRSHVGDVRNLLADPDNMGATFQVASQFNLLEMPGFHTTPDEGISNYDLDGTQGPICAIAAGPGTIVRQYFCFDEQTTGQSSSRQIDCLGNIHSQLLKAINNKERDQIRALWEMKNGYALFSHVEAQRVTQYLEQLSEEELDNLRANLEIGVMPRTQITMNESTTHTVTQAYCSAIPVAYCVSTSSELKVIAKLVLEATYEAALLTSILESQSDRPICYLTLVGGGVFGNDIEWIAAAIDRALEKVRNEDITVVINQYHQANNPHLNKLFDKWGDTG